MKARFKITALEILDVLFLFGFLIHFSEGDHLEILTQKANS